MQRMRGAARRWVFAAGVLGTLGFGAAQAVAAPAAPGARDQARACNPEGCDRSCRAQGGFSGRCTDAGLCACLY